jgi:hypothetical protein
VAKPGEDGCGDGDGLLGVGELTGARVGSGARADAGDGEGDGDGDGARLGPGSRLGNRRGDGLGDADGVGPGDVEGDGDGEAELCATAWPAGRTTSSSRAIRVSTASSQRMSRRRVPARTLDGRAGTTAGIRRS